MIEAVVLAQAIQSVEIDDDGMTFVWAANSPEQLEAALNTLGWEIVRRHAVCEPIPDSPSPN